MVAIDETDRQRLSLVLRAGFWALIGLFGSQLLALLFASPLLLVIDPVTPTHEYAAITIGSGIGFVVLAGIYLWRHDLDLSFLDVSLPSPRDLGYSLLGFFVLLGGLMVINLVIQSLDISTADHSVIQTVSENNSPEIFLMLVPLSFLVIAPAEEIFYRNIVQKSLYPRFTRLHAVLIASAIFALVHVPAYLTSGLAPLVTTLPILFVLALVLGESYRRTHNLVVPILVHGAFNAFQFLGQYLVYTSDISTTGLVSLP
ncbi:CPBP family intramembrane metalloprotease [Halorhabdus sp. CBA1104]|uniref:CPBP family intramembrane glutamic endopeptidase n=1 Tax=unclassified Halorhabdus TaxID=2621901 RepID=UPI0012B2D605|nr:MULTISPECIES: type II CAAX endopeptidase family protein [unclassified Halorhabdus]QGN07378.1 CPBP family intramembrane metalloprotease [Halorhabdus sp. CBA1104]